MSLKMAVFWPVFFAFETTRINNLAQRYDGGCEFPELIITRECIAMVVQGGQREYLLDQAKDVIKEIHNVGLRQLQIMRKYKMNRFRPEKFVRRGWLKSQKYACWVLCREDLGGE